MEGAISYVAEALNSGSDPSNLGRGAGYPSSSNSGSPLYISGIPEGTYDVYVTASSETSSTVSGAFSVTVPSPESKDEEQSAIQEEGEEEEAEVPSQSTFQTQNLVSNGDTTADEQEDVTSSSDVDDDNLADEDISSEKRDTINSSAEDITDKLNSNKFTELLGDDTSFDTSAIKDIAEACEEGEDSGAEEIENKVYSGATALSLASAFDQGLSFGKADLFAKSYAKACLKFYEEGKKEEAVKVTTSVAISVAYAYAKGDSAGGESIAVAFAAAISGSGSCTIIIVELCKVFFSIMVTAIGTSGKIIIYG